MALVVSSMGLQEHFRNAAGDTQVAVDLKRRMGAKEVGVNAAALVVRLGRPGEPEEVAQQLVGAIGREGSSLLPCLWSLGEKVRGICAMKKQMG